MPWIEQGSKRAEAFSVAPAVLRLCDRAGVPSGGHGPEAMRLATFSISGPLTGLSQAATVKM